MSALDTLLKVLNLDGVQSPQQVKKPKAPKKARAERPRRSRRQAPTAADAGSLWEAAGEEVSRQRATDETPWHTERETGSRWYWTALRIGLLAVLAVFVFAGVRSVFVPPEAEVAPVTIDPRALFPDAEGAATAERFTESYLTWDEDNAGARSAALALDVAQLDNDGRFGWDGSGKQTAADARVMSMAIVDEKTATATVSARITTAVGEDETTTTWVALDVPLAVSGDRVIVTGQPAFVAVPAPVQPQTQASSTTTDSAITSATRDYVDSFFTAYGRDDDVSAMTAPDSDISGLGGVMQLEEVVDWTVYDSKGDTRDARAVVSWLGPGDTLVRQTYSLTLTEVSGGSGSRWQISEIN